MKQNAANQDVEKARGTVAVLGIDLAKNVFSLHGVDASGRVVLTQTVSRAKLAELMAKLPPYQIGMEACGKLIGGSVSNYRAREHTLPSPHPAEIGEAKSFFPITHYPSPRLVPLVSE